MPGTGVFLSTFHREVPPMLLHYVTQTRALPEKLVILSVLTTDAPEVEEAERVEVGDGARRYRVTAHLGFMETPDVPQILAQARRQGVDIDLDKVTYYLGRITLVPGRGRSLPRWRRFLFTFMLRNAVSGSTYMSIPPAKRAGDRRADGILRQAPVKWGEGFPRAGSPCYRGRRALTPSPLKEIMSFAEQSA